MVAEVDRLDFIYNKIFINNQIINQDKIGFTALYIIDYVAGV